MTTSTAAVHSVSDVMGTGAESWFPETSKRHFTTYRILLQVAMDYVGVILSISLTCWIYRLPLPCRLSFFGKTMLLVASLVPLFSLLVFRNVDLYNISGTIKNICELANVLRSTAGVLLGILGGLFFFCQLMLPLGFVALVGFLLLFLTLAQRQCAFALLHWARQKGCGSRRAVIYGGTKSGIEIFREFSQNPRFGLQCVGIIDDDSKLGEHVIHDVTAGQGYRVDVLGTFADLREVVHTKRIETIVVADPLLAPDKVRFIMHECEEMKLDVMLVPGLAGHDRRWLKFGVLDGLPLAQIRKSVEITREPACKRAMDLVLTFPMMLLFLPFLVLVGLAVFFDSGMPIFFSQERVGKRGKRFKMWKFRSMRVDSPKYARSPSSCQDPRITTAGRWLRRTSLDELPQLFNVLMGDMSLVGPRPEMPHIVDTYGPTECTRLRVLPGITGLWQISDDRGRPIHENIQYDLFYVYNRGLAVDCAILLATVFSVFRGKGAC